MCSIDRCIVMQYDSNEGSGRIREYLSSARSVVEPMIRLSAHEGICIEGSAQIEQQIIARRILWLNCLEHLIA